MNTSNPKWDFTLIIDRTFFSSLCEERESPIDEIGSIFTGKTKKTRDYVFQGMKVAGIGTMGFFIIIENIFPGPLWIINNRINIRFHFWVQASHYCIFDCYNVDHIRFFV